MVARILKTLALLVVLIMVVGGAFILHWMYFPSIPRMDANQIESVEVELYPWKTQKSATIVSDDVSRIERLLTVLRGAERTSDHKCGDAATIRFKDRSRNEISIGVLPGHDPDFYEYRYGSRINRVDRAQFLEALRGIGVTDILLDP